MRTDRRCGYGIPWWLCVGSLVRDPPHLGPLSVDGGPKCYPPFVYLSVGDRPKVWVSVCAWEMSLWFVRVVMTCVLFLTLHGWPVATDASSAIACDSPRRVVFWTPSIGL